MGLTGCGFSSSYYLSGEGTYRPILKQMFAGLTAAGNSPEHRYLYMREVIKILRATGKTRRLNLLLTDYVRRHRHDPYDAYYLYVVAEDYVRTHAIPFADLYFSRVINGYPDLSVDGRSIDYQSLTRLVKMTRNPYRRIIYYKELLSRFQKQLPNASAYYHLAESYKQAGEWSKEIQAYANFLRRPNDTVPGKPNARRNAAYLVNLYNYPHKDWAYSNLNDLVGAIRHAIDFRSVRLLSRYWAKVGFFARSWDSSDQLVDPLFLQDFEVFMTPSVYVAPKLDVDSNSQEAYLKTGGWSYRIPTWYFYFKKINFPEDPNLQGKWEWVGIYFGHKLFSAKAY
jgi:tetratricopeptide (TPR) repeat protein